MTPRLRKIVKRILLFFTVVTVVLFLLACLAPHLNPQQWWFISFLGLGFPFLLLAVFITLVWWLFLKARFALIPAVAILLGIQSIKVFIAFRRPVDFKEAKDPASIRVATWNVARFLEMKRNNNKGSQTRMKMMEQIEEQNADVLCFQEFFHSVDSTWYPNLDYVRKKFNYPYYYYSHDNDGDKHYIGNVIFSRYPIIDSGMIRYPRPTLPESLMHADIKFGDDTIRVFTTHLQSVQFQKKDYETIDRIKGVEEDLVSNSRTIFSKLRRGISYRKIQTDIVRDVMNNSPHKTIFMGDLNDVPNSYTYFKIKGEMQDAFLKKGFGIGRTFTALSPTLRIDYIFADRELEILQFKRIARRYSDHYMIVADIRP